MEKTEYRAVIKFFVLEGLSAKTIYKNGIMHFPMHRWVLEFKRGRTSVEDQVLTKTGENRLATDV